MALFTSLGVAAFLGTTASFFTAATAFVLNTAVGVGLNILAAELQGNKKPGFSVQGTLQSGGDVPRTFMLGRGMTPGSLVYANSWGKAGKTPNAYFTQVVCVGDWPVKGLAEVWVYDKKVTLGETPHSDYGYPVEEFRKEGVDYLWIKFYDGTQTVADPFLVSTVSSEERPYESTRVGTGCPYVIATSRVADDLFTGFPTFKFVIDGIRLYDITKDTTAGGSGDQRWDDQSTWGGDGDYLSGVQLYCLLRGLYNDQGWFYGLQGVSGNRLPAASWIAQIGKCRAEVEGPDGDEPTFRCAGEVPLSAELGNIVEGVLSSCVGRLSEVGGYYRMLAGEPDAPVLSFTDDDISSRDAQTFTPFFGIDDTITGISARYPEPEEGWNLKVAPPIYRSDLEEQAGDRRRLADPNLGMVPYTGQVQRLQQAALREAQRARRHTLVLPPEFWKVEPLDTVSWTSERNGYTTKSFRIDGILDRSNLDVVVDATEIDGTDYGWNQETDYQPPVVGSVGSVPPPAQTLQDFLVVGAEIFDGAGNPRRPGAILSWNGDEQDDVAAVAYEVRLEVTQAVIHTGRTEAVSRGQEHIAAPAILPNEDYQLRAMFVPTSARLGEWTDWMSFTTPNILVGPMDLAPGAVELAALGDDITEFFDNVELAIESNADSIEQEIEDRVAAVQAEATTRTTDAQEQTARLRDLVREAEESAFRVQQIDLAAYGAAETLRQDLSATAEGLRAAYTSAIAVAVGPGSAVVTRMAGLESSVRTNDSVARAIVSLEETARVAGDVAEASARQTLATQLRGSYTGTDPASLVAGLLYNERLTRISAEEALAQSITLLSAGVGEQFDWAKIWYFDSGVESFTGNGTPTQSAGFLRPANHASDPYVVSPTGIGALGSQYPQVKLRIRKTGTPAWEGYLWWRAAADATWDAGRRVSFSEPTYDGNGIGVVTIEPTWSAVTVDRIRIDLTSVADGSNYAEFDWIAVGRPSPGASSAALATEATTRANADTAETSARELLSSTILGNTDPTGLTLGTLSSGIIYSERETRATADSALGELINTVDGRVTDLDGAVLGSGGAIDVLTVRIGLTDGPGGTLEAHGERLTDIETELPNKAAASALSSLSATVNDMGGVGGIQSLGQQIVALRAELPAVSLALAEQGLANLSDRLAVQGVIAQVNQALNARVTVAEGTLSLVNQFVTSMRTAIPGFASSTAVQSLETRVIATEVSTTSQAGRITELEATIGEGGGSPGLATAFEELEALVTDDETGLEAVASDLSALSVVVNGSGGGTGLVNAVSSLAAQVNDDETGLEALGEAITGLSAQVGGNTAEGLFRAVVLATPSGALSRVGLSAAASSEAGESSAALLLDAVAGGESRVGLVGDRVYIVDPENLENLTSVFAVVEGTVYMQNVVIGNAIIEDGAITSSKRHPVVVL